MGKWPYFKARLHVLPLSSSSSPSSLLLNQFIQRLHPNLSPPRFSLASVCARSVCIDRSVFNFIKGSRSRRPPPRRLVFLSTRMTDSSFSFACTRIVAIEGEGAKRKELVGKSRSIRETKMNESNSMRLARCKKKKKKMDTSVAGKKESFVITIFQSLLFPS